jgi:hypothetical protein
MKRTDRAGGSASGKAMPTRRQKVDEDPDVLQHAVIVGERLAPAEDARGVRRYQVRGDGSGRNAERLREHLRVTHPLPLSRLISRRSFGVSYSSSRAATKQVGLQCRAVPSVTGRGHLRPLLARLPGDDRTLSSPGDRVAVFAAIYHDLDADGRPFELSRTFVRVDGAGLLLHHQNTQSSRGSVP